MIIALAGNYKLMIAGSYLISFLIVYLLVAFILYSVRSTEVKIMNIVKDPKKSGRGRKQIVESIDMAKKEMKTVFRWPVFLIKGLIHYVKSKTKEKKE